LIGGDSTQLASSLIYTWDIKNDKGGSYPDVLSATYTIVNADKKSTSFAETYNGANKNININLYKYLN
jgi:hypothetical protein